MKNAADNGIYYFLGNTTSHILHALPLHRKLGGTFVVLSDKARRAVATYSVPVINIDNKPYLWARFGYKIKPIHEYARIGRSLHRTIEFLNNNAKVVLFYELYDFDESVRLTGPKTIFLTHGNMLKSYMNESNRLEIIKQYDYMAALGPYLKQQFIRDGIDPKRLVDIGIARTDEIVANKGKIIISDEMITETGIDPTKPIIAYLPTFWGASSIYDTGKQIVRDFPDDYTLLFRPHPQTPQRIIDQYLDIIRSKPGNVIYAPEGRYKSVGLLNVFAASSIIIGDVSSVMLEAVLTEKPLIFAFGGDEHAQKASNYEAIQSVVDASAKITPTSISTLPDLLASTPVIDTTIWQKTSANTFFHAHGDSVQSIDSFVTSLL